MKVCLVNPPLVFHGGFHLVPLGLAYVAAAVRDCGHDVSLVDAQLHSREYIIQSASRADVVGITSMSNNFLGTAALAEAIKRVNPEAIMVMGGPHVTFTDSQVLKEYPGIDVIVRHEGEYTMRELLQSLDKSQTQ